MRKGPTPKKTERGRRPKRVEPSKDKPVQTFFDTVPAQEFHDALMLSTDAKFEQLGRSMLDPRRIRESFAAKLIDAKLTLPELYEFWHKHQLHIGLIQIMNRVPKIMTDVATDAESRLTACSRCDGTGQVNDAIPNSDQEPIVRVCPACEGTRQMRVIGDKAARDLVFESIGLTGKTSPTVAIQQNFGLDSELGDVLQMSQKVITGGSE